MAPMVPPRPAEAAPGAARVPTVATHRAEAAPGRLRVATVATHRAAAVPGRVKVATVATHQAAAVLGRPRVAMAATHPVAEVLGVAKVLTETPTTTVLMGTLRRTQTTEAAPTTRVTVTLQLRTAAPALTMVAATAPTIHLPP